MKTMTLLGFAALVAIVLVFFITGEFKNKSTFSSDGHVNSQSISVSLASLDEKKVGKDLYE
jgi:hypothetical protein